MDYITLMLLTVTMGLAVAAWFFWKGPDQAEVKGFVAPLAIIGLLAGIVGLAMTLAWPIPGKAAWANSAFGEPLAVFGAVLLAASLALAKGWSLRPVTILAFLGGAQSIDIGVCMGYFHLTQLPILTTVGFLVSGLAGLLTPWALWNGNRSIMRRLVAVLLVIAALIWAFNCFAGYAGHFGMWSQGTFLH